MREDMKKVWGYLIQASKSQVGPIETPKGEKPHGAEFETPVSNGRGLGRVLVAPNRGLGERCDLPLAPAKIVYSTVVYIVYTVVYSTSSRKSCTRSQMSRGGSRILQVRVSNPSERGTGGRAPKRREGWGLRRGLCPPQKIFVFLISKW